MRWCLNSISLRTNQYFISWTRYSMVFLVNFTRFEHQKWHISKQGQRKCNSLKSEIQLYLNDLLIWLLFSQFTLELDKGNCVYPNNGRRNICFLQLHIFGNMCVILARGFLLLPWTIHNLVYRRGWGWPSYSTRISKKVTIWKAGNDDSRVRRLPLHPKTSRTITNCSKTECNHKEFH